MTLFVRVLILLAPILSALCLWPAQAAAQTVSQTITAGPQRTERNWFRCRPGSRRGRPLSWR